MLAIIAAFFLLKPPPGIGIAWFILWKIVYDFAWAAKNVAYSAWGSELSNSYDDRSRIVGSSTFASQAGYVFNEMLPVIVFGLGLVASSTYSMSVMGYYFLIGAIAVPFAHIVAVSFVPRAPQRTVERPTISGAIEIFRSNPPFRRYLLAFFIGNVALGNSSLTFIFYDGYLKVGGWFPWIMTSFSLASLAAIPLWVRVSRRIGKHRTYAIGTLIAGACPLSWLVIRPAAMTQHEIVAFAFAVVTVMGVGLGCNSFSSASILGDVVDYGTLRTGNERTGTYFACYLLVTKVAVAIGGSLAYMTIAAFGFDAKAGAKNSHEAILAFLVVYALIPPILKIIGALLMYDFPLTARRHAIVRRRNAALLQRRRMILEMDRLESANPL